MRDELMSPEEIEAMLGASRGWAGLTSHGQIRISLEAIASGKSDWSLTLSHETAHDVMLKRSAIGAVQLVLSSFAMPSWPLGPLRQVAEQLLAVTMRATNLVHEGWATAYSCLHKRGSDLAEHWERHPAAYQTAAEPFAWLREFPVDAEQRESIGFAIARAALSPPVVSQWTTAELYKAPNLCELMLNSDTCPNQRYIQLNRTLSKMTTGAVIAWAGGDGLAAPVLTRRWTRHKPLPMDASELETNPADTTRVVLQGLANLEGLSSFDRQAIDDMSRQPEFALSTVGPTLLSVIVCRTVAVQGHVITIDEVEPFSVRVVEMHVNALTQSVPGIERVNGTVSELGPERAALWLTGEHELAAHVDIPSLIEFLGRLNEATTVVAYDGCYDFSIGDIYFHEILAGHPHLVLLNQGSIFEFIRALSAGGLAGERTVLSWQLTSIHPGILYLCVSPATAPFPVVVAPTLLPCGRQAADALQGLRDIKAICMDDNAARRHLLGNPAISKHLFQFLTHYDAVGAAAAVSDDAADLVHGQVTVNSGPT